MAGQFRPGQKIDQAVWNSIFRFYVDTQIWDNAKAAAGAVGRLGLFRILRHTGPAPDIDDDHRGLVRRWRSPARNSTPAFESSTRTGATPQWRPFYFPKTRRSAGPWNGSARAKRPAAIGFGSSFPGNTPFNKHLRASRRAGPAHGPTLPSPGTTGYREGCELPGRPLQHEEGAWYQPGHVDSAITISTSFALAVSCPRGRTSHPDQQSLPTTPRRTGNNKPPRTPAHPR